ncbi:MAG: glycoside hydrolase family 31 [Anaerolinea sp.]|nr:glycoside hydrolase family 31 [Anaerolinea sp.]
MIRHRPFGLGHPYRLEPDQRVPTRPVEGEAIELRATTGTDLADLAVELTVDGGVSRLTLEPAGAENERDPAERGPAERIDNEHIDERGPAEPTAAPRADRAVGHTEPLTTTGHLAAAATRQAGRERRAWGASVGPFTAGTRLSYRFVGDGGRQRTRRFEAVVAGWTASGGRLVIDPPSAAGDRLVPGSVAWLRADTGPIRVRFALRLEPEAHVVGFGERFDRLDQRGRRLDAVVFEQYKHQGNRTYLPMPFAIMVPEGGAGGWGFHVRTSRRTWFDVGASHPERLWIEVELDPDETEPEVEVALYDGPPPDVLRAFVRETGAPRLPPDWVFHPWMSGNEWNTQARVTAEVERSLAEGIPAGVVVIEAWSDETTFTAFRDARYEVHPDGAPHQLADFTFPADGAWPDPKGLVEWLHGLGIRLLLWQVPLLKTRPAPSGQARADRDTMIARSYGVGQADGRPYRNRGWWFPGALLPDFTSSEATRWWIEKRRYLVEEVGIDGFKTDGGEHAWGHDLRYADGTRGDVTNNRYPVLYAAAYHRLMASCDREPVTFSRAGFTGAQSHPCHWAGDEDSTWEAFRASITAGLTAGASGVFFWGWDLAGFSGEIPSAELYLRAAAMACFCPIMQYHSEFNHHHLPSRDRTPWNIAERTGDPRVIPVFRRFAQLREGLVPYLVEQARRSVETGRPLMRALVFDWPNDPTIWDHPIEYMLGDDLLVAPVTEPGVASWQVYLPEGGWVDAWTGEPIRGPRVIEREAPLDQIPVYVAAGEAESLLPLFRAVMDG